MNRLNKRGEISKLELKNRMTSAVNEYDFAIKSNKFIFLVNNNVDQSAQQIRDFVKYQKATLLEEHTGIDLAKQLKEEAKNLLSTLD